MRLSSHTVKQCPAVMMYSWVAARARWLKASAAVRGGGEGEGEQTAQAGRTGWPDWPLTLCSIRSSRQFVVSSLTEHSHKQTVFYEVVYMHDYQTSVSPWRSHPGHSVSYVLITNASSLLTEFWWRIAWTQTDTKNSINKQLFSFSRVAC